MFVREPAQARRPALATSHVANHQDAVTQVAEIRGLEAEPFPTLGHVAEELTDAADARIVDGLPAHADKAHLEGWIDGGDHRFGIPRDRHHRESGADDLQVVRRHRPPP